MSNFIFYMLGCFSGVVAGFLLAALLMANHQQKEDKQTEAAGKHAAKEPVYCQDCVWYNAEQKYCYEWGAHTSKNDSCTVKGRKKDEKY